MLRRVLVPLDGSSFAESALPIAISIAQKTGGELHLVTVLEAPALALAEYERGERERAEEYFEALTARLRQVWPGPLHTSVRAGWVAGEIASVALEWGADVIVMSTHGRGGLSRLWMGSIAERCVRTATCPTLLVRPSETEALDLSRIPAPLRIVLPLDGSELAERAIPFGVTLSMAFSAPLLLLRVLNQPRGVELAYNAEAMDVVRRLRAEDREEARAYLTARVESLRQVGVQAHRVLINRLGPAEAILTRDAGDWIVITTNGLGGLDRIIFGSVADKVVRSSKHPLLVIPPARAGRSSGSDAAPQAAVGD
jgi:nucleotide-binding universal stress UspA family protein